MQSIRGIKKIIVHSHGYNKPKGIRKTIFSICNPIYKRIVNEYLACSKLAGQSLLRTKNIEQLKVIKNGIEIDKYKFNNDMRLKYRKELKIEDKIVYGHVGRMCHEKNHKFLLELFNEIQKIQSNSVLLLIGEGELEKNIDNKIKELKLEKKVIRLGYRDDTNYLYNCMDAFLFPSIKEGLGLALIEAQTNGLPVFCSNSIPQEAEISPKFYRYDLTENILETAKNICNKEINTNERETAYKYTINQGYDINDVCAKLDTIYNME